MPQCDSSDHVRIHPTTLSYHAACRHGVKPIASGHRLCLIYNLVQKEGTPALQAPYDYHMSKVQQLMELVRQWQEDKEGPEKLILQLQHKYALLCNILLYQVHPCLL